MRKSILIGVLAALMLFAFTACEQNPTTPLYGAQVENITVVSQPVFVQGQDLAADEVVLSVNYNDGTSVEYKGNQLLLNGKLNDEANIATATFAGKEYKVIIKAYKVTAITIDLSTLNAVSFNDNGLVTPSEAKGVFASATATTAGGPVTTVGQVSIEAADIAKIVEDNELKINGTFTLTAELMNELEAEDSIVSYTNSKTLTYVDETAIAYIVAKQTAPIYAAPENSGSSPVVANSLAEAKITVEAYNFSGEKVADLVTAGVADTGWTLSFERYDENYAFTEVDDVTITVTVTGSGANAGKTYSTTSAHPFVLEVSEDYPVAFSAAQVKDADENTHAYYNGEIIDVEDFDFSATKWASGFTGYVPKADLKEGDEEEPTWTMEFSTDPERIPYDKASGTNKATYGVIFTCTVDNELVSLSPVSVDVYATPELADKANNPDQE